MKAFALIALFSTVSTSRVHQKNASVAQHVALTQLMNKSKAAAMRGRRAQISQDADGAGSESESESTGSESEGDSGEEMAQVKTTSLAQLKARGKALAKQDGSDGEDWGEADLADELGLAQTMRGRRAQVN